MSHQISLKEAIQLTSNYRENKEVILEPQFRSSNVLPFSETFEKSDFEDLLKDKDCVKIRAYFGMNDKKEVCLVFVGVNEKDQDILPKEQDEKGGPVILERGQRCPPICPDGISPLSK